MVINIGSNFATVGLLTFFLLGMDMDVVGSALATSLSMCLCSVVAMIPFLAKKTLLQFVKPKFNKLMFKEIAACGSPVFLSNIAGRVTSILINVSLMTLGAKYLGVGGGTTAVAAYSVLMYASDMCQPLLYGISDALSPAVGYNWGAESYDRVKRIAKCSYIGTGIVGVVSTVVMFLLAAPLASLFVNAEDAELLALSAHAIRLFCFAYLFRWVSITTQSFLSAIEKPVQATVVAVSVALVFPALILGAFWNFGLDGIWLNMLGTSVLSAILAGFLLLRVKREIKRKI